jgi:hypothetical protein
MPIIPVTQEAEAAESQLPSAQLAWAKVQDFTCKKKKKKVKAKEMRA